MTEKIEYLEPTIGAARRNGEAKSEKNIIVDRACANPAFLGRLQQIAAEKESFDTCIALFNSRINGDTYLGKSLDRETFGDLKNKLLRLREEFCRIEKGTVAKSETGVANPVTAEAGGLELGPQNIFTMA